MAPDEAPRYLHSTYEAAMAGALGDVIPETHVVYGSVSVRGDRVLVGLWAVSVADAMVVGFAQAEGSIPDGLFDAVERASRELVQRSGMGG